MIWDPALGTETEFDGQPDGHDPSAVDVRGSWAWEDPDERYREIRTALNPEYADASDAEIEAYVAAQLPGASAQELENVLGFLRRAAPNIAGGALSGLQLGTTIAPGWGTLIGAGVGAVGGGLMSLLGQQQPRPTAPRPRSTPRPRPRPAQPRGATPPLRTAPPSSAAAGQLLALLSSPQVIQALTSLVLGAAGRSEVEVEGGTAAPTEVAQLIADLADAAARANDEVAP